MACQDALLLAKSRGYSNIKVEGDSYGIIDACKGKSTLLIISGMVEDSLLLSQAFHYIYFIDVRRYINEAAYTIVRKFFWYVIFHYNHITQMNFVLNFMPH